MDSIALPVSLKGLDDVLEHWITVNKINALINHSNITAIDLSPLQDCPKLQTLEISKTQLKTIDIAPLKHCSLLEKLTIRYNHHLKRVNLSPLQHCPQLYSLDIHSNQSLTKIPSLKYLPQLQVLTLFGNFGPSIDLSALQRYKKLHYLGIGSPKLAKLDLSPLIHSQQLRRLKIGWNKTNLQDLDLSPLKHHTHLLELEISPGLISQIDLSPLQYCLDLQQLKIGMNQLIRLDLSPLQHCLNLQFLEIHKSSLKAIDLSPLKNHHHLQVLRLMGIWTRIDLSSFQHLPMVLDLGGELLTQLDFPASHSCRQLKEIWVQGKSKDKRTNLTRLDLSPLQYSNIEAINLAGNRLTEIDLGPLQYCKDLQILSLDVNELRVIDFTPLQYCSKLHTLRVAGNNLTEIDLTPLQHCKELRVLYIGNNPLKTVDISPLFSCSKLGKFWANQEITLTASSHLQQIPQAPKMLKGFFPRIAWQ